MLLRATTTLCPSTGGGGSCNYDALPVYWRRRRLLRATTTLCTSLDTDFVYASSCNYDALPVYWRKRRIEQLRRSARLLTPTSSTLLRATTTLCTSLDTDFVYASSSNYDALPVSCHRLRLRFFVQLRRSARLVPPTSSTLLRATTTLCTSLDTDFVYASSCNYDALPVY
jgi:tellurite resistance protein